MNYTQLMKAIDSAIEQLGWSQEQVRSYLGVTYGRFSVGLLTNDELSDFLKYLLARASGVVIPVALFDEIEAYLESQAAKADGEASRLLMALEDLEIDRNGKEYLQT